MSIIIHFNTSSFIQSSVALSSAPPCISRARTKLAMVPGIDEIDQTVMTDDESSMVDIATSNTLYTHTVNDLKNNNHVLGSCFGLPYQDHNYGAPPPPTPPSYSPCTSPAHANGVPDEDTNLSIVSTSTTTEEIQDRSITRCICGFEHDDEYMICCDLCLVWQHVDCMGLDRNNIPETYLCEKCEPRKVDRHKAKVLQTRKKVAMTDSSDSEDDAGIKNEDRKPKSRKRKRREREKNDEKSEHSSGKRSRQIHKNSKERIESKRSILRRTKNKESTSTADEEAQDAWEISLEWCEKNFEIAVNNQYTPEVQHLAKTIPLMGKEERLMELLLTRNCQVIDGNQKKLISIYDIPRDQPLVEYKGKFLLASQFYGLHPAFNKKLFPFVMFYTVGEEEICVDASVYGNEARFVRRSCKPNAELRHLVYNGNLHLYISSTKAVFKEDEITLPLDFSNLKDSIKDVECACESEDCFLKCHPKNGTSDMSPDKRKKGRKLFFSADEDSSHSFIGSNVYPSKCRSFIKSHSQPNETTDGKYDHETEEQANERKKKTREERKIDAIMRAFEQMEKAAKRRQQALERQKAHHPKIDEVSEKSGSLKKEEDKAAAASGSETQCTEEEKLHTPALRTKKGKRRRSSAVQTRRRTRTNSGGSDILSPEENILLDDISVSIADHVANFDPSAETSNITVSSQSSVLSPVLVNNSSSPVVLKTKRFLLHEWLQEKSETNINSPTTSSVSVHSEVKCNTTTTASSTCYVQCTKDNPHCGGISAAHLRRSSSSNQIKAFPLKSCSEQGFTKKRWLRQAMFDYSSYDEPLSIDPGAIEVLHFDNGELSPTGPAEMGSPTTVDSNVTPLKKRRLIRESLKCASSPLSPSLHCYESSALLNSTDVQEKTEIELHDHQILPVKTETSDAPAILTEGTSCKISGLTDHISETLVDPCKSEKNWETLTMQNCKVSIENLNLTAFSNCEEETPSVKLSCDSKNKICDDTSECIKETFTDEIQTDCTVSDASALNVNTLVSTCTEEKIQSDCDAERNSSDKHIESVNVESTSECNSIKQESFFSDDSSAHCSLSEDNFPCSLKSSTSESNDASLSLLHTKTPTSESADDHTLTESQKLSDCNNWSNNSPIQTDPCKTANDHKSEAIFQNSDQHSSVSCSTNVDESVRTVEHIANPVDNADDLTKNMLSDFGSIDSDVLCDTNLSEVINVPVKSSESSEMGSKSFQNSVETSSLAKTNCASATQKRKVSLSEYRLRMKDGSSKRITSDNVKKSTSSSATAIPETLPEQVTLAPLPLFDVAAESKSPPQTPVKTSKTKKETKKEIAKKETEKEVSIDITEHRENLTERLKREFGFDDDSEGLASAQSFTKSVSGSTPTMPLCAQPPPPPPPPPPRLIRPLQVNTCIATASSASQFSLSMPIPYARASYIVPQIKMPSSQFIPVHQTLNTPSLPPVHSATTPGVQCSVQPALLPSSHSFASTLSGTALQPSIQHEFQSVNAQNYATLVQQLPPPPPPKSFTHAYQTGHI